MGDSINLAIDDLARDALGPVLRPGTESYAEETSAFNAAINHRPDVVVGATCESDVEVAVRFAARHRLPIGVQSTGHGQFRSANGGMLITTTRMDSVTVDPVAMTATLGAGVRWRQVLDASAEHGLAPMAGSASAVGAVGYMLGGGLSHLGRKHGFAADHVLRFRIVTADGQARDVDADHHPDLFWAVRGGKGNFGIVTEVEINLLPLTSVFAASIYFGAECIESVLRTYADWVDRAPEEFTSSIAILRVPDLEYIPAEVRAQTVAHFRFVSCRNNDGDTAAMEALEPIRASGQVLLQEVGRRAYRDLDGVNADPTVPMPVWQRSAQLRSMSQTVVTEVLAAVGPDSDCTMSMVEIRHLGGALARSATPPNAVAGRSGAFSILLLGVPNAGEEQHVAAEGKATLRRLRHHLTGRSLANWLGSATDPDEVVRAWDPEVRKRLMAIKSAIDPNNLFRRGHPLSSHSPEALPRTDAW